MSGTSEWKPEISSWKAGKRWVYSVTYDEGLQTFLGETLEWRDASGPVAFKDIECQNGMMLRLEPPTS